MKKKIIISIALLIIAIAMAVPFCKTFKERAKKAQTNIEQIQDQNDTPDKNN